LHSDEFGANIVFMPIEQSVKQKNTQKSSSQVAKPVKGEKKRRLFFATARDIILFNKQNNIIPIKKLNVKA